MTKKRINSESLMWLLVIAPLVLIEVGALCYAISYAKREDLRSCTFKGE